MFSRPIHVLLLVAISSFFGCERSNHKVQTSGAAEGSFNKVHLVHRKGDFFEKGKIYGVETRKEIQGQLKIWKELCREEIDLSLDELHTLIIEKTGFFEAIENYSPELLEEIKGIAFGAEVNEKHLLTLNVLEEIIVLFSGGYESCTNIALQSTEVNALAYNLDLPEFLMQFKPVILDDDERFFYAFPGILATGGMNSNFAVTTNSLPKLMMDTDGLPLPFMIRKLLQFTNEENAIAFLQNTPLATPQNIMIVGRNGIYDFECSAGKKVRYYNPKSEHVVYHTNHALINEDFNPAFEKDETTCERFAYLESVFAHPSSVDSLLTVESLIDAIDHRPSKIRYEGNYLSFLATFPKHQDSLPKIEMLVPKDDGIENLFKFN